MSTCITVALLKGGDYLVWILKTWDLLTSPLVAHLLSHFRPLGVFVKPCGMFHDHRGGCSFAVWKGLGQRFIVEVVGLSLVMG